MLMAIQANFDHVTSSDHLARRFRHYTLDLAATSMLSKATVFVEERKHAKHSGFTNGLISSVA